METGIREKFLDVTRDVRTILNLYERGELSEEVLFHQFHYLVGKMKSHLEQPPAASRRSAQGPPPQQAPRTPSSGWQESVNIPGAVALETPTREGLPDTRHNMRPWGHDPEPPTHQSDSDGQLVDRYHEIMSRVQHHVNTSPSPQARRKDLLRTLDVQEFKGIARSKKKK